MNKIFTLLCSVAFASHCTFVSAQHTTMQIHLKSGEVAKYAIEDVDSVTFGTQSQTDRSQTINGHMFVDLGLPSGVLWAATNVGAATAADDGDYYAWGETATKAVYTWDTYKWTSDGGSSFTKYVADSLQADAVITLEAADDAAATVWGVPCRMPSSTEIDELRDADNCTWDWTEQTASDGSTIEGYKVTSVKNGNSIFIPASGYRVDDALGGHGSYGNLWSSELSADYNDYANYLYFTNSYIDQSYDDRYYGHTVRPVAVP